MWVAKDWCICESWSILPCWSSLFSILTFLLHFGGTGLWMGIKSESGLQSYHYAHQLRTTGLKYILKELPKRDASQFRSQVWTLASEAKGERSVINKEMREPLPLIIHHLPVAITFGFIGKENIVVIDPNHYEEDVMRGSMTTTLNTSGDVCAIQKAGGEGVLQSVIMQCLRIASVKAGDITSKIKNVVQAYNTERSLRKIKRHDPSHVASVSRELDQ